MSRVVLLIGHERAGTHLLGSILDTHPHICYVNEICNCSDGIESIRARWGSFFGYKLKVCQANPNLVVPLQQNQRDLIKGYIKQLRGNANTSVTLLDIKYGHIHNFNQVWTSLMESPFLFQFIQEERIRVIHLYRKHVLAAVCSTFLARARNVWNTGDASQLETTKLSLDVDRVGRWCSALTNEKKAIESWLPKDLTLTITYEELIYEGQLNPMASRRLAQFLGVDEGWDPIPNLVKVSPPVHDYVENLSAIKRRILWLKFDAVILSVFEFIGEAAEVVRFRFKRLKGVVSRSRRSPTRQ